MITDPANSVMVSAASSWEIAIKVHSGRWPEARALLDQFVDACADLAASILVIDVEHTVEAGLLEWSHRDPFDRMLAAQALVEDLALVTVDKAFDHEVCRLALASGK
jgi:PIN domain nuclease of toxin-antitoxin system